MEYSNEQTIAFQKYMQGRNIFITGPGGAGKSQLIKDIYKDAVQKEKNVQVCALTGCAAVLLGCKAKTIHSWAGIGLASGSNESIVVKILKNIFKKKTWKQTDILILDEVSMMSKKLFELLDDIGKKVRKSIKPFGGMQIICSGDFYQLPPVGDKNQIETIQFCFESSLWHETFTMDNHVQLTTIFRQKDPVYSTILNQIREGKIKKSSILRLNECIGREKPVDAVITKLFPMRNKVERINQSEMVKLTVEEKEYILKPVLDLPMTEREKCQRLAFSKEQIAAELQFIQSNLLCESKIRLKVGSHVMCVVNIALENCGMLVCNGSQGIIVRINEQQIPIVKYNNGIEMAMQNHVWASENIPGIGVSQVPLILAWALTIHKCQGATLDSAEIDVGEGIFECGQTYVALSRVKSLEGLFLTSFDPSKIRIHKKVREFYDLIDSKTR